MCGAMSCSAPHTWGCRLERNSSCRENFPWGRKRESEYESDDQDKKKWSCSALPMDDEEWSSGVDTDESDYDSDELYDSD